MTDGLAKTRQYHTLNNEQSTSRPELRTLRVDTGRQSHVAPHERNSNSSKRIIRTIYRIEQSRSLNINPHLARRTARNPDKPAERE